MIPVDVYRRGVFRGGTVDRFCLDILMSRDYLCIIKHFLFLSMPSTRYVLLYNGMKEDFPTMGMSVGPPGSHLSCALRLAVRIVDTNPLHSFLSPSLLILLISIICLFSIRYSQVHILIVVVLLMKWHCSPPARLRTLAGRHSRFFFPRFFGLNLAFSLSRCTVQRPHHPSQAVLGIILYLI